MAKKFNRIWAQRSEARQILAQNPTISGADLVAQLFNEKAETPAQTPAQEAETPVAEGEGSELSKLGPDATEAEIRAAIDADIAREDLERAAQA